MTVAFLLEGRVLGVVWGDLGSCHGLCANCHSNLKEATKEPRTDEGAGNDHKLVFAQSL